MKCVVQRVRGLCRIVSRWDESTEEHSFEGPGLVVLLGWEAKDEADDSSFESWLIERIKGLRIFPDHQGRMNQDLDTHLRENKLSEGGVLWVPQFTLAAELKSGFRPSFTKALAPDLARKRFESLTELLRSEELGYRNIFGVFGAEMELSFTNWGPVTIPFDSEKK